MILPTIKWVKSKLRNSLVAPVRVKVLDAFVVGSVARGKHKLGSDLDIAVIINPIHGKSSVQYSEIYHSKFDSDVWKPVWLNMVVDFEFFIQMMMS